MKIDIKWNNFNFSFRKGENMSAKRKEIFNDLEFGLTIKEEKESVNDTLSKAFDDMSLGIKELIKNSEQLKELKKDLILL